MTDPADLEALGLHRIAQAAFGITTPQLLGGDPFYALNIGAFILAWGKIEYISYAHLAFLYGKVPPDTVREKYELADRIALTIQMLNASNHDKTKIKTAVGLWNQVNKNRPARNKLAHGTTLVDEHGKAHLIHLGKKQWFGKGNRMEITASSLAKGAATTLAVAVSLDFVLRDLGWDGEMPEMDHTTVKNGS
jgi:hypothetical protein